MASCRDRSRPAVVVVVLLFVALLLRQVGRGVAGDLGRRRAGVPVAVDRGLLLALHALLPVLLPHAVALLLRQVGRGIGRDLRRRRERLVGLHRRFLLQLRRLRILLPGGGHLARRERAVHAVGRRLGD